MMYIEANRLLWRISEIRHSLLTKGMSGESLYGLDEWSTPIVNLDNLMKTVEDMEGGDGYE